MVTPTFRFAPSPNGYLHLGHAYSALFTWDAAKKVNGKVLLRMEDIDIGRCRPEFARQILDDLAWLGLSWPEPVRVQSEHFDDYRDGAAVLADRNLLYPCFCTRKQIAATAKGRRDPDGAVRYSGSCKKMMPDEVTKRQGQGEEFALRLDMSAATHQVGIVGDKYSKLENWGDVILVRKDIPTSYHLSVVVDDALQKVTHVTRGMDMFAATAIHMLLQRLLGLPTPTYQHHRLINSEDGRKLAKSAGDRSLKALRAEGVDVEQLLAIVK